LTEISEIAPDRFRRYSPVRCARAISSGIVGCKGKLLTHEIDNDEGKAYAKAVGASAATVHPLFPVCFE